MFWLLCCIQWIWQKKGDERLQLIFCILASTWIQAVNLQPGSSNLHHALQVCKQSASSCTHNWRCSFRNCPVFFSIISSCYLTWMFLTGLHNLSTLSDAWWLKLFSITCKTGMRYFPMSAITQGVQTREKRHFNWLRVWSLYWSYCIQIMQRTWLRSASQPITQKISSHTFFIWFTLCLTLICPNVFCLESMIVFLFPGPS